jgi:hypothetical protein
MEETVKRTLLAAITLIFTTLPLAGCGGGDGRSSPPVIVTQILSDPVYDGDIAKDPASGNYTVTQGNTQSVLAGIDPTTSTEYRTFLDFPLTGAGGVPGDAVIVSATIDIVINSINPYPSTETIPIRIDLVSFQPPTLIGTDFDRTLQPALVTRTISPPISQSDFGNHVAINVTNLMNEAQRLGLPDLQVRILEDLGAVSPGFIEINDTTGPSRDALAPLLQVSYH